jgi:hypothetical protein
MEEKELKAIDKILIQLQLLEVPRMVGNSTTKGKLTILINDIDIEKAKSPVNDALLNYFVIKQLSNDLLKKQSFVGDLTDKKCLLLNSALKESDATKHKKIIIKILKDDLKKRLTSLVLMNDVKSNKDLQLLLKYLNVKNLGDIY